METTKGIIAKNTTTFELVPAGNHIARCYSMIEIGTVHDENFNVRRKLVRISWELPNERKVFKPENGEQPFAIHKEYTLSMNEKANLRKDLESWRGKGFTEKEAEAFDITKLLGIPCMVNIIHRTGNNGNQYANVVSITPIAKGVECPAQVNQSFVLSYSNWSDEKFKALPEWIRKKMEGTEEFQRLLSGGMETSERDAPQDDSLPF